MVDRRVALVRHSRRKKPQDEKPFLPKRKFGKRL